MGTVSARGRGNESYHPVMATLLSGNVAAIARISEYAAEARATAAQSSKGSFIRMVSSRSGEVLSSATGAPISSSTRRTYFTDVAGRSTQIGRESGRERGCPYV